VLTYVLNLDLVSLSYEQSLTGMITPFVNVAAFYGMKPKL